MDDDGAPTDAVPACDLAGSNVATAFRANAASDGSRSAWTVAIQAAATTPSRPGSAQLLFKSRSVGSTFPTRLLRSAIPAASVRHRLGSSSIEAPVAPSSHGVVTQTPASGELTTVIGVGTSTPERSNRSERATSRVASAVASTASRWRAARIRPSSRMSLTVAPESPQGTGMTADTDEPSAAANPMIVVFHGGRPGHVALRWSCHLHLGRLALIDRPVLTGSLHGPLVVADGKRACIDDLLARIWSSGTFGYRCDDWPPCALLRRGAAILGRRSRVDVRAIHMMSDVC